MSLAPQLREIAVAIATHNKLKDPKTSHLPITADEEALAKKAAQSVIVTIQYTLMDRQHPAVVSEGDICKFIDGCRDKTSHKLTVPSLRDALIGASRDNLICNQARGLKTAESGHDAMRRRIDGCLALSADPLAAAHTPPSAPTTPMLGHMRNLAPLHDDIVEGLLAEKTNPTAADRSNASKRAHRIIELTSEILLNRGIDSEDIPSKASVFIRSCKQRGTHVIDPVLLEHGLYEQNLKTYVHQCESDGDDALVTHGHTSQKICDLELSAMQDPTFQVKSAQAHGRTATGHARGHV